MDRAIPEINRYVTERQIKVNKNLHKQKLKSVAKIIDMSEPASLSHPINKAKKEQMVDGKPFYSLIFGRAMQRNRTEKQNASSKNDLDPHIRPQQKCFRKLRLLYPSYQIAVKK
jgi:hypothetical protein